MKVIKCPARVSAMGRHRSLRGERKVDRLSKRNFVVSLPSSEAAQKGFATRPQAEHTPEAYPLGYVEDVCEPRTTLRAFFSSL
jgi:hypothetical protein